MKGTSSKLGPAANLEERLMLILKMEAEKKTLQEIGNVFGISRERVRQILKTQGISRYNSTVVPSALDVAQKSIKGLKVAGIIEEMGSKEIRKFRRMEPEAWKIFVASSRSARTRARHERRKAGLVEAYIAARAEAGGAPLGTAHLLMIVGGPSALQPLYGACYVSKFREACGEVSILGRRPRLA